VVNLLQGDKWLKNAADVLIAGIQNPHKVNSSLNVNHYSNILHIKSAYILIKTYLTSNKILEMPITILDSDFMGWTQKKLQKIAESFHSYN
jgi:hypothetical protein